MVRVDLTNFHPVRGRITLNLTANRTLVAQKTVAVAVDGRRTVYLRTTFDIPGRYALRLGAAPVGTVEVTPAATGTPTTASGRSTESSPTVAPTPEPAPTDRDTAIDGPETGSGTRSPARTGSGTVAATPAVGPDPPTGTETVVAVGMSLMLLYGVGVAVYVLREHSPSDFE